MTIESASIATYEHRKPLDGRAAKELMEALVDVTSARSTRDLMRESQRRQVKYAMRVPLLKPGYAVLAAELGKALRKVVRSTLDAASPGDHVVVDFVIASNSRLEVRAGSAAEMGGIDESVIDQIYQN